MPRKLSKFFRSTKAPKLLVATAGSTVPLPSRRGAAIIFVVGILALVAVLVLVFTATGLSDTRVAKSATRAASAEDQVGSVAAYLSQVIADSTFATVRQRQLLTANRPAENDNPDRVQDVKELVDKVFRRTWTVPGVDPELVSLAASGPNLHRQFNPTGTIVEPWPLRKADDYNYDPLFSPYQDPRIGVDPWLSSIEPTRLNRSRVTGSLGLEFGLQNSLERFKDRTDWLALSNFAPDGRAINLANLRGRWNAPSDYTPGGISDGLTLLLDRAPTSEPAQYGPSPNSRLRSLGAADDGIMTTVSLPLFGQTANSAAVTGDPGGGPIRLDRADPNRPAHWFTNQVGVHRPVGDGRFAPGDPRSLDNQFRDVMGTGFYNARLFELVDGSTLNAPRSVIPTNDSMRLFVAAKAIDLSGLINVNTASSLREPPTSAFPLGSTPADVDLERLLAMRRMNEYPTTTTPMLYGSWGQPGNISLPSFYAGYEQLVSGSRVGEAAAGSGFTALIASRLYGDRALPGVVFKPVIGSADDGLSYSVVGQARVGANARYDTVMRSVDPNNFKLDARARARLYNLTKPERSIGTMTRADLRGLGGTATDSVITLGGRFGLDDELELRSFNGLNRVSTTSSLELVLDGRNQLYPAIGPMRSNRPASVEQLPRLDLIDDPTDLAKATWATGLKRDETSIRGLITTISAQRPLITDPSRPLSVVATDQVNAVAEKNALAAAIKAPLDTADLPTSLDFIVSAVSNIPTRVRSEPVDTWTTAAPYVAATPVTSIPNTNFDASLAVAQLFRGYLDSLAPDLAGRPILWEGGDRRDTTTGKRMRTRSLAYGDRHIQAVGGPGAPSLSRTQLNFDSTAVEPYDDSNRSWLRNPQRTNLPWLGSTAELSARLAAHLTVNFLDMNDVSDRPSAFTLILDPALKATPATLGAAYGTSGNDLQRGPSNDLSQLRDLNGDNQPDAVGYQFTDNGVDGGYIRVGNIGLKNTAGTRERTEPVTVADGLVGRLPDYRLRGVLDLDAEIPGDRRPGDTTARKTHYPRDYDASANLDSIIPTDGNGAKRRPLDGSSTPPMVNVYGIKPQPFLTAAVSLVLYADSKNYNLDQQNPPLPPEERKLYREIDGEKAFENPDFLCEIVAFQLHNPFDRTISLTRGSSVLPPAANDAAGLKQYGRVDIERLEPGSDPNERALSDPARPGYSADYRDTFQYYIEFAGRYYAVAELVRASSSTEAKIYGVNLQPGETRMFYAIAQDPTEIVARWNFASAGGSYTVDDFYKYVNRQLAVENVISKDQAPNGNPPNLTAQKIMRAPVRLLPVDPRTMQNVTPKDHPSGLVLTALPTNVRNNGGTRSGVAPIEWSSGTASDTEVRLWRRITDEQEPTGPAALRNDLLVDRLRQPQDMPEPYRASAMTTKGRLNIGFRPVTRPIPPDPGNPGAGGAGGTPVPGGSGRPNTGPRPPGSTPPAQPGQGSTWNPTTGQEPARRADEQGNGGAVTLWAAIVRPGMAYTAPEGAIPSALKVPQGVLPPWLLESKSRITNRNEVFDSFDQQARRPATIPQSAAMYVFRPEYVGISQQDGLVDLSSELVIGRARFDRLIDWQRGVRKGDAVGTQIPQADQFSDQAYNTNGSGAGRLMVTQSGPRPSLWQLKVPTTATTVGLDVEAYKYEGAAAGEILLPPAIRAHNPIDPPSTDLVGDVNQIVVRKLRGDSNKARWRPNLSGVFYRTIIDRMPPVMKHAQRLTDQQIDAGVQQPQPRLTDLLMAWAIGPFEVPLKWTDSDNADRSPRSYTRLQEVTNLDERFTTLSEAIALALDYDAPIDFRTSGSNASSTDPTFDRANAFYRVGQMVIENDGLRNVTDATTLNERSGDPKRPSPLRGVVLDGGHLSLTQCAPFDDINGTTRFELTSNQPDPQHGSGVPFALNILNRFRETTQGGISQATYGLVNLNTAPRAALSALPLVMRDPGNAWQMSDNSWGQSANGLIDEAGAAIVSYRDQIPQWTVPIGDNGSNPIRVDFSSSGFIPVNRASYGGVYDRKGRKVATGIMALRDAPGFQSFGELLAARFADANPAGLPSSFTASPTAVDRAKLQTAGTDRFGRGNKAVRTDGILASLVRDVTLVDPTVAPGKFDPPTGPTLPVPEAASTALRPADAPANYEAKLAVAKALANTTTVRSDTFCVWFTVEGYRPEDVQGLERLPISSAQLDAPSVGDLSGFVNESTAKAMVPSLKRRYMMIVDRSNVITPGDRPKVLLLQELPFSGE